MNDNLTELECELRRLRPRPFSPRLTQRIALALDCPVEPPPSMTKRFWRWGIDPAHNQPRPWALAYAGLAVTWAFILAMWLLTAVPQPISPPLDPALVAIGAGTAPQDGAPIFASVRLAKQELPWDPADTTQP